MATAKFPATTVALVDFLGELPNFPTVVLSGAHTSAVTTITLTAAVPAAWPTVSDVTIDTEIVHYTGKFGSTLTGCTRGSQSTTAATHADQAVVGLYLTAATVNQLLAEVIALETQIGAKQDLGTVLSATPTWNWALGATAELVLGISITALTLSNPLDARFHFLKIKQDATGSRTITWPASVDWGTAAAPTLSTAANKVDLITLYYDSSSAKYYGTYSLGYAS